MESIWMGIAASSASTRVMAMKGPSETFLKARLDAEPKHSRALGTLLTCQFSAPPWTASTLTTALIPRPREARVVSSVFAVVTVSDFLHQLYAYARRASR